MKKNIFNEEINKILLSVGFIEKKFKKYYFILDNIKDKKQHFILFRNLFYIDLIVEKIKDNFREIEINKKIINNKKTSKIIKKKLKINMKKNIMVGTILLKVLVNLLKNYQIDRYDFQVQTIVEDQKNKLIKQVPNIYLDKVKEEFSEISFNYQYFLENYHLVEDFGVLGKISRGAKKIGGKIVSGAKKVSQDVINKAKKALNEVKNAFNKIKNFAENAIRTVGDFFKKMFDSLKSIVKILRKIGDFFLKSLVSFIKLFWKLLSGLMNFITVWIPRLIKNSFTFLKYLSIKAKKTGLVTIGLYFGLNIVITKYWDLLVGDTEYGIIMPSQMISYPSLFFTTYIFWTQTPRLSKIQNQIITSLTKNLKILEFFFVNLLGLPKSDIFTKKMSFRRRLKGLSIYIKKNITKILIRILILIFLFKIFVKSAYGNIVEEGIPDFRDIILFPVIIIKFAIQNITRIYNVM